MDGRHGMPPSSPRPSAACAAPSAPPLSPSTSRVDVYALPLATPVAVALPPQADAAFRPPHDQQIHRSGGRLSVNVDSQDSFCPSAWSTLWFATRLVVYHAGYCVLSVVGAAVVVAGLSLSLLLLPLCGFGIVVFQSLLQCAHLLARADAKLHNLIADDSENEIYFPESASSQAERRSLLPIHGLHSLLLEHSGRPRFHDASLDALTPRAVLLVVYFGSVRPLLCLWSVLSLVTLLFFSLLFVGEKDDGALVRTDIQGGNEPLVYALSLVVIVLSGVSLHIFGRVSQAATRFFCCE